MLPAPTLIDRPYPVVMRREGLLEAPTFTRGMGGATEYTALAVDTIYACVRLIADAVSGAQVNEWRGIDPLEKSRLAIRPMQRYTMREWLWQVTATLALYNVCPLIARGGEDSEGVPWSLVPVAPPRLSGIETGQPYLDGQAISPDSIKVVRRAIFPSLSLEASSLLRIARDAFTAADAATRFSGDWWASGGAPLVTLSTDADLTREQTEEVKARWVEKRAEGPGVPAVLNRGIKAETFGADLGTEQVDTALERMGAAIARYFGVPPSMVNVRAQAGSLTYSTTESQGLMFVRYTLDPYAGAISDALSDYLPGDYVRGRRISLDLSHLTRAEQNTRFLAWESAVRAKWLLPDEVRAAEGYAALGITPTLDAVGPPAEADELEEVPA